MYKNTTEERICL